MGGYDDVAFVGETCVAGRCETAANPVAGILDGAGAETSLIDLASVGADESFITMRSGTGADRGVTPLKSQTSHTK